MKPVRRRWPLLLLCLASATGGCAARGVRMSDTPAEARARSAVLARSQVWRRTNVARMNLKDGPRGAGAFPFGATVRCRYVDKHLGGMSPKFVCAIGEGDEVKVKFGAANGEVYGEVLATRLLWALGFGADRMYPVDVVCSGCPDTLAGVRVPSGGLRFDPAVVERRMAGREWPPDGKEGWAWNDLNVVNASLGGAPRAHRDALKLLAVFLQHTDSKPEQQRVLCQDRARSGARASCRRPFLMISDVGVTFGRANRMNANETGSVNLVAWRDTPVWKGDAGCTGNLPASFTGTLADPVISEEGRRFLADLLGRLSDRQLRDLFAAGRVQLRPRSPENPSSGLATVEEWVAAFKAKRAQILERRCA
jgi:hypothetical protein